MASQIARWLSDWFSRGWKASLFVGALVSLAHDHGWLDTIDTYAMLAIGNVGSEDERRDPCSDLPPPPLPRRHVIAIEIDQRQFDKAYLARSPLDRCELKKDLKQIYDSNPALLVIDLDLSPALWIMNDTTDPQKSCEIALHDLIRERAPKTPTVMMTPFDLDRREKGLASAVKVKDEWRESMKKSDVAFGAADIPVTYGVVVRADARPSSLLRVAYGVGVKQGVLPYNTTYEDLQENEDFILIDPRKYFRSDGVQPRPLDPRCCNREHILSQLPGQIVFFGAAYGSEGDTFLTPAGEIYGVEVHAASLLSYLRPLTHGARSAFLIDFILASIFSLVMRVCGPAMCALEDSQREMAMN